MNIQFGSQPTQAFRPQFGYRQDVETMVDDMRHADPAVDRFVSRQAEEGASSKSQTTEKDT